MAQPEPTIRDVIELIQGVETRLGERIDGLDQKIAGVEARLDKKIDDLAEVVERMAEGHNRRFSVIEEKLGIDPPRGSEGWKPELLS